MEKLTDKQKKFADKYIETLNATQSAIHAGYSKKTARHIGAENLHKPNIASYIEEQLRMVNKAVVASQEEVLAGITSIARNSKQDKDRLKAYELLGKRYALFTDKTINEHTINKGLLEDIYEELKE